MSKEKKDVFLFFISKIIIGIIGLISMTIYSKVLTTEEYGNYSLITSFVNALVCIFIGWIGSASLRYYIEYNEKDEKKSIFY